MWKEGSQIIYFLLKLITIVIVYGKVDHNILVMKNKIACNRYV